MREGLPLMMEVNENDTLVTYTAVSVTPRELDDALFSVPRGYTIADRTGKQGTRRTRGRRLCAGRVLSVAAQAHRPAERSRSGLRPC